MNRLLALALCVPFAASSLVLAQEKKPATPPAPTTPAVTQPKKDEGKKDEKRADKKDEGKKEEKKAEKKEEGKAGGGAAAGAMPDEKAMMEAWEKAGTPGEKHKWIEQFEGEWQASVVEYGMDGKPGAPEKGTMSNKMALGGRFAMMEFKGRAHGKFFYGHGMLGYNNTEKRFENTWVDSMSSNIMFMTGTTDSAGRVLTMAGECMDPMSKQKCTMREVTTIVDKNTMKSDFYMTMPGAPEAKMMEITYTKGAANAESKGEKKEEKAEKKEEKKAEKK